MRPRRLDPWAVVAAAIAAVMLGVYLALLAQQDGTVAAWFVGALLLGAMGAGYGSVRSARYRRAALVVAGVVLVVAGVLGILTIGFPVVVAGALSLVAAGRASAARSSAGRASAARGSSTG